jgi:Domain of unknown function (DUF4942)/Methionine biosynthesis protein MetW
MSKHESMNLPALPITVADIVDEYAAKVSTVDIAISEFQAAHDRMNAATVVRGTYVENVVTSVYLRPDSIRLNLRKSGWKAVYSRLQIERLASAKDKRLFEQTLANPPDLTLDNARATFGDYLMRPRFHALRALAECFVQLDPAYKSHSKVKIGVTGLPKRVILSGVGGYGSYGRDRLRDILNALATVQYKPTVEHDELRRLDELNRLAGHQAGEIAFDGTPIKGYRDGQDVEWTPPARGVTVRKFQNGNGHVIFDPPTLFVINRALAEFYGEVLPDAEDDDAQPRPSTEVAKDLQFYPTPRRVIDEVLDDVGLYDLKRHPYTKSSRVLEPSCGDGRILDVIRSRGHIGLGFEVHGGRAMEAKAKGHSVICGNFLEAAPNPVFDFVVMNPPFHGQHWRKHLAHARKFIKPEGAIACVLPATAWYDHGGLYGTWHDLPVASFAESGTNIPTGFLIVRK